MRPAQDACVTHTTVEGTAQTRRCAMLVTEARMLPGEETLIASWRELARTSPGARVDRSRTAVTAVSPAWEPLNNAILLGRPTLAGVAATAAELTVSYRRAGVRSWALWLPSALASFLGADIIDSIPGMVRDTTTLVMYLRLHQRLPRDARVVRTTVAAATRATDELVRSSEIPESDGSDIDAWVLVDNDVAVAGGWGHLRGTDCGLYAVATVPGR